MSNQILFDEFEKLIGTLPAKVQSRHLVLNLHRSDGYAARPKIDHELVWVTADKKRIEDVPSDIQFSHHAIEHFARSFVQNFPTLTNCGGPQILDKKDPFLRWSAALKMKEESCPKPERITRPA
jgi:hypothetical protein